MDVEYRKAAIKSLRKIPKREAERLMKEIDAIAMGESKALDITKLKGREGYRLRMGRWRAIYRTAHNRLTVLRVGPRGDIYK
jgi:mRNA interferase RelE/StbE